jgi:hypothetical protein
MAGRGTEEYNLVWQPKCGSRSESPNNQEKRKGFRDNVEAHESTCDTRPAQRAGASEYVHREHVINVHIFAHDERK